jgi:hypothetical protein
MRIARLAIPLVVLLVVGCSENPPPAPSGTTQTGGPEIGAKPNPTKPAKGTVKAPKQGNPLGPTGVVD